MFEPPNAVSVIGRAPLLVTAPAADETVVRLVDARIEDQRAVIDDASGGGNRAVGRSVAQLERPADVHGGCTGIGVRGNQDRGAGTTEAEVSQTVATDDSTDGDRAGVGIDLSTAGQPDRARVSVGPGDVPQPRRC